MYQIVTAVTVVTEVTVVTVVTVKRKIVMTFFCNESKIYEKKKKMESTIGMIKRKIVTVRLV